MRLISISKLRKDTSPYADVIKQVEAWSATVRKAKWKNLEEVKTNYRDAEAVGNFTVFNIKGNRYRLIVGIDYVHGVVYYKYFLTHADYDKDRWKNDPHY